MFDRGLISSGHYRGEYEKCPTYAGYHHTSPGLHGESANHYLPLVIHGNTPDAKVFMGWRSAPHLAFVNVRLYPQLASFLWADIIVGQSA